MKKQQNGPGHPPYPLERLRLRKENLTEEK